MPAQEMQEKQFMDAYHAYADAIFRYCYYRVFESKKAEDFVKETYCQAWKHITNGNTVENIMILLYKTANDIITSEQSKKDVFSFRKLKEKFFAAIINAYQEPKEQGAQREAIALIKSLDEQYQNVIVLTYINGLSQQEISLILDEPLNDVCNKAEMFEKLKVASA